jgi:hypothetical protein
MRCRWKTFVGELSALLTAFSAGECMVVVDAVEDRDLR